MQHLSLTPFGGQPLSAGLLAARALATKPQTIAGTNQTSIDKWSLFNDLREARARFGVTDRDLGVLYALLTFLPAKALAQEAELIVFPSNASLSDRAHGMAESTLRRHLAALVRAGLLLRHDSPNGKRYAARDRSGVLVAAFGFDLRPLLTRAPEIIAAAETCRDQALALRRLRETLVLHLRDAAKLLAYGLDSDPTQNWPAIEARLIPLRRTLRRKIEAPELADLCTEAGDILADIHRALSFKSEEMHATDAQNERHHTNSNKDSKDFEPCLETGRGADQPSPASGTSDKSLPTLPLYLIIKACPDLEPYAQGRLADWRDLIAAAGFVRGMMGVSASAWEEAKHVMGPETASAVIAAMLQRIASITNPGGYLRALSAKAATGAFSVGPMIMSLLNASARAA